MDSTPSGPKIRTLNEKKPRKSEENKTNTHRPNRLRQVPKLVSANVP